MNARFNPHYHMRVGAALCQMRREKDILFIGSGEEFEDAVTKNTGPALRKALTMLVKIPVYRDAHATDDRLMSAMFVAGLLGSVEDIGTPVELDAEDWELTNMCDSQYTFGNWESCHESLDSVGGSVVSGAI